MWLSPGGSCAATFPGAACKINKIRGWRGVPAISRQNVHKLTHCLSLIWRIIPLPPSTHLSIFTSSPEWHCYSMFPGTSAATISGAASKIDCQIKDGIFDLGTYSVNGKYNQIEVEFL